jgi:hypothetical protein
MSNPNGESLQMEIPVYAGIMRKDPFFNNHPMRDRPQNM